MPSRITPHVAADDRPPHRRREARVFTWVTRVLLAVAFLPSGLVKLQGARFTRLGIDNPVGFFFEAFYRTGIYWNFLGAAQLLAAALILIPRTRVLGAIVYFPIILNIFLITYAMRFQGTVYITGLMLLGSTWLLLWDARTLRCLFDPPVKQLSAVGSQLSAGAPHRELDRCRQA